MLAIPVAARSSKSSKTCPLHRRLLQRQNTVSGIRNVAVLIICFQTRRNAAVALPTSPENSTWTCPCDELPCLLATRLSTYSGPLRCSTPRRGQQGYRDTAPAFRKSSVDARWGSKRMLCPVHTIIFTVTSNHRPEDICLQLRRKATKAHAYRTCANASTSCGMTE